ncbi:protein-L-isoaspartate O-methyltransferase [Candidatus Aerophobetes bacterium]|uniref:Protein-L-isoaspartate O-methyltransferase n=1 Tax=Aerophobetes bacterium TaxID=2030807 RepID=A0A662DBT2_UNCAE|nr:MAG: protein-L-isoaspartate O-methyltransferase [Candidatus Aerophobetes bacterium]
MLKLKTRGGGEVDYKKLREEMVKRQLIPRGINDRRVLDAFLRVEREKFVPSSLREDAYKDFPLSIGEGQTISQPYMAALMTQCLNLRGEEKILEIGTGSGYQTAILALLGWQVYSVERIPSLAEKAKKLLKKMGYDNVKIFVGNGTVGLEQYAPYDRILVTAGAKDIPPPLIQQLAEEGIMVIPVGNAYSQELMVVKKKDGKISSKGVERCVFVPLIGQYGWEEKIE